MIKFPHSHSLETAAIAHNYPYGLKLKTDMAYYVEYRDKKGWRAVRRSLNPKTGEWNSPHAGTYSRFPILVIADDTGTFLDFDYCPNPMAYEDDFMAWVGQHGHLFSECDYLFTYFFIYCDYMLNRPDFQAMRLFHKNATVLDTILEWRNFPR